MGIWNVVLSTRLNLIPLHPTKVVQGKHERVKNIFYSQRVGEKGISPSNGSDTMVFILIRGLLPLLHTWRVLRVRSDPVIEKYFADRF